MQRGSCNHRVWGKEYRLLPCVAVSYPAFTPWIIFTGKIRFIRLTGPRDRKLRLKRRHSSSQCVFMLLETLRNELSRSAPADSTIFMYKRIRTWLPLNPCIFKTLSRLSYLRFPSWDHAILFRYVSLNTKSKNNNKIDVKVL